MPKPLIQRISGVQGAARTAPYFLEELSPYAEKIHVATEDGSYGSKGFVTDILNPKDFDLILCCGPNAMMQSVKKILNDTPALFSLESHMACGIGACLACSVRTVEGMKRVCREGPVFPAKEVCFS
ncbi:hypothetical protein DWQ65_00210 [Treponema phagedenis]|nr:hypothetical protein [Treponema phagedenis]QEJ95829.1 hypothetical protein FUT79_11890 [Treponema phagedenis]QEK00471.1 hypothetical protein FUT84_04280 [Treponema phagedenis]QEK05480.1 hypothetical protein FUT80_01195 [Treponema phagedenis]QKS93668.1 hypothetical protein HPJ96_11090 [Treponema phagedenis]